MDDYLDCLYFYIQEHRLGSRPETPEYRHLSRALERAAEQLESMLSPEQLTALDAFRNAQLDLCRLEDMELFREAVALGKWMAR